MTDITLEDPTDGIWDDGEFVSWNWINGQLYERDLQEQFPSADIELVHIFDEIVQAASSYKARTGRFLQIWGELGELYAELKFGIERHAPGTQGSDGRIGNDFIEIKTISPEKGAQRVEVKRAGNFNKLLIVRINEDFEFDARMVDRKTIRKSAGKLAKVRWVEDAGQETANDQQAIKSLKA